MTRIRTLNFLPEIFQTPTNRQFLAATLDQIVNPPVTRKIEGYIGSRYGYGINAKDYYVTEPTKVRTEYQLDPGVVFTKPNENTAQDFISYPGILDALKLNNGITNNNDRLFSSQFYSWDSFANLDKLINFNQYYWLPEGPPAVQVSSATVFTSNDFVVTDLPNAYNIRTLGSGAGTLNPTITLIRGGSYNFIVNQETNFWIQGEPGVTGYSPIQPNLYVRDVFGVTNNGATQGIVNFTVPAKNAQDQFNFPGNNLVDVVSSIPFAQINGQLLNDLENGIDGITALDGLTVMFYNTGIPNETGYVSAFFGQSPYDENSGIVSPVTINVSGTNSLGFVICDSTEGLTVGNTISFTGAPLGFIDPYSPTLGGTIYYITEILSPTTFTISNNIPIESGNLVPGRTYTIKNSSNTDFTLLGAANNNEGTRFIATGTGLVDFVTDTLSVGETYSIVTLGDVDWDNIGSQYVNAGSFELGVEYVITTLGTTDWNQVANTVGITYNVGDSFAPSNQSLLPQGSGTGIALVKTFVATGAGTGTVGIAKQGTGTVIEDQIQSTASGSMIGNINQGLYEEGYFSQINDWFYRIRLLGDPNNPVIQLIQDSPIPIEEKITAVFGTEYIGLGFYKNTLGFIQRIPYITAPLDILYYQDGSNPNKVGIIRLIESNLSNTLNVETDILGKKNFTSTNGVVFTNGLKVEFDGDVIPSSYLQGQYYVEGVGTAIELIPVDTLVCPEAFTRATYAPYDILPYDIDAYDAALFIPLDQDYITIARNSISRNPWSRSNRWFHVDVINATANYNQDPNIVNIYATSENKAKRPIIEFYPNIRLFETGTEGKLPIDFIDFRTTDAFNQVAGQENYYPDVQVYSQSTANIAEAGATFQATLTGTTLTVSSITSGTITLNSVLSGLGITNGTIISATNAENPVYTGTGGAGTYQVSLAPPVAVSLTTMTTGVYSTTVTIDADDIVGNLTVNQFITDSAGVLPLNATVSNISGTTTLTITVVWDDPSTFVPATNVSFVADDVNNANYVLFPGARIVFAADENENVKNKIYVVNYSQIVPGTTPIITLTEAIDGDVFVDTQLVVLRGYNSEGKSFYFDGINYLEAQQKITVNQPPLFDVFDNNGISLGNKEVYIGSSFNGCKLFSYGLGFGTDDPILGIPLRYSQISNVGDISFDISFNIDEFTYVKGTTPERSKVNTGYIFNYSSRDVYERLIGWQTAIASSVQYQLFSFDYLAIAGNAIFECDVAVIPAYPEGTEGWPRIQVFKNNVLLNSDEYSFVAGPNNTRVTLAEYPEVDTIIQVALLSDQVSKIAYYSIPINLSNNPLNGDPTIIDMGDIRPQYASMFTNNPNNQGNVFGSNNYRDLGNLVPYGNRIIQNSASLVLPATFLRKPDHNLFYSLMFNSREYIKFKTLLMDTVNNANYEQRYDPSFMLDDAIDIITASKSQEQPFFWSDMLPNKAPYIQNTYRFQNQLDTSIFALSQIYNFDTANYNSVLVYLTRTEDGLTYTKQLIRNVDYIISTDSPSLTVTIDLTAGDVVVIREYNQTYGSYVPNTPTKLGLYPSFIPQVVQDTAYIQPTYFIRGHDGSYTKLYGEYLPQYNTLIDFRDQVLLEFETRIYNNLKLGQTIPIRDYDVIPGYFRTTDYGYDEINEIYSYNFLDWIGQNRLNYKTQLFNKNNPFTYNYDKASVKLNNSVIQQGNFRGLYQYFFDTTTPNATPWEMLGYTDMPSWWTDRYGPAPYTSDNLILWNDLANGYNYNNGDPYIMEEFIRPNLLQVLPVSDTGQLLAPIDCVVGNYWYKNFQQDWDIGDAGPTEFSYRRSSTYPFDLMKILALTKPAEFFNLGVDLDNYRYNEEFNQWLVNDRNHLVIKDIEIYGNGIPKTSYINWIVDFEKQFGIDATTNIKTLFNNLDVRLVYRLAGYSDKSLLKFYVEKGTPNSTNASLLIPDESYGILLYDNQPYDKLVYSGVIVQVAADGFSVYGNSQTNAYFPVSKPKKDGQTYTVTVEDLSVKVSKNYTTDFELVPYGTIFGSVQEVAQFLTAYGAYTEQKGVKYTQTETGIEINWNQMVAEFLYWAQLGWERGSITMLNPAAKFLEINKDSQIVQPLTMARNNFILNQNLYPIQSVDLNVIRDGTLFSVEPLNQGDTIAYAQFNLSNFEHGIVFDNITLFDDIIYNLITGLKQQRIYVRGTKSAEWNGTVFASGFIYNQDNVREWNKDIKYTKGEIVLYKNRYWTALTIIQPSDIFNERDWKETEYQEIQKGLLPNSSTRSYESTLYYDVNKANLEQDADLLSYSLIGFRPRPYLDTVDLTDITQINVYKNLIRNKGTRNSLNAFKGANLPQGGIDYEVYENWAIKSGEFGGTTAQNFVEFRLNQNQLTGNPSTVGLTDGIWTPNLQQQVPLYSLFSYNQPITNPNILPTLPVDTPDKLLPDAGYVNFNDVKLSSYFYSTLPNGVDKSGNIVDLNQLYVRDYIYLANYLDQWQVLTPAAISQIIAVRANVNGTSSVQFTKPHGLQRFDFFAIINFNIVVDGYFLVLDVIDPYNVLISYGFNSSNNNRTITGNGVGLRFNSQRVAQPSDINNLDLLSAEFTKNTVWVDENFDGSWAVFRKSLNYQYEKEFTKESSLSYGSAVAYDSNIGYLISDSEQGQVYRYTFNDLTEEYQIDETLIEDVSFGTSIVHQQNLYVVSQSQNTPKVFIYTINDTPLTDNLYTYQEIDRDAGATGEWGTALALSGDTNYLFISATDDNQVYVYRKGTNSYSAGYFEVGQTYQITNLGDTDFTAIGADDNLVGLYFVANGIGAGTGTAVKVTYELINVIDASGFLTAGDNFGSSITTNYDGSIVTIGAPNVDYSISLQNWGRAYIYTRTIQNVEAPVTGTTKTFSLAYSPNTIDVSCTATTATTNLITCADTTGLSVNKPIMFVGTNFGDSGIEPFVIYYVRSVNSGTTFTIKSSRSSTTAIELITDTGLSFTGYQQDEPLTVTKNGIQVDDSNYGYYNSTFVYVNQLQAGDIVNIGTSNFVQLQELTSNDTPRVGVQYGTSVATPTLGQELLISAPFALTSTNQEGVVYRYSNGGAKFGLVVGTSNVNVTVPRKLLINGYLVTIPVGNATVAANAINAAKITNIQAINQNGNLIISVINTDLTQVNQKLVINSTETDTFTELGLELYTETQNILCPHELGPTQFGTTIKYNEFGSVVISAPVGTRYAATTFDFTDNEDLDDDTVFDNNATQFVDNWYNAGAVYMYDYLPNYNESLSNSGTYVYAQSVNAQNLINGSQPKYGLALDFNQNRVVVGSPFFRPDFVDGQVITFINESGIKDWTEYRQSCEVVDISKITTSQIFSAQNNETLINLDYFDPLQGKLLGAVMENIDIISNADPASYTNNPDGTVGNMVWGAGNVGQIWFDTTNVRFVNYHQNDAIYNSEYWGRVFPGSDVAVYSWIASSVPPSSYEGPGQVYDIGKYTVQSTLDASNLVVPVYYYWVRNTNVVFRQNNKTLPDSIVASYIQNPNGSGISYISPLLPNAFALYNSQQFINANDSVLHIGYTTGTNDSVAHNEYTLIRANYADDFLPGIPFPGTNELPRSLYDRMLDSLCGVDETGGVVPNPYLPKAVQSGVLARPRQSFFFDRYDALKNYLTFANAVLSQFPIFEIRQSDFLYAKNPRRYEQDVTATQLVAGNTYKIEFTGTTDFTLVGASSNTAGTIFVATGSATGTGITIPLVAAGDFEIGKKYVIETVGTTNFVSIGADNNNVGTSFTATGVGSGTGNARLLIFDIGEEYDTTDYWSLVNWWAQGYDNNTKSAVQVAVYADLLTLNVPVGTIATVERNGNNQTEIYRYDGDTIWSRIGLVNGTIAFNQSLWNYSSARLGFGDNFFDTDLYDLYPSQETRFIVRALNEEIYTNDLLIYRNQSLILLFEYIESETVESQNYLPWLNKTSLVDVNHKIRELLPLENFQTDNQDFLAGYLNEAKPYHVVIKDFLFNYTGTDVYGGNLTDFDLPAQYDFSIQNFVSPQLVYKNPNNAYEFLPTDPIWEEQKYNEWYSNYGVSLTGQENYQITTLASYVTLASNSLVVANGQGFPINGVIRIGQELIGYSSIDRSLNLLTGLTRGLNGTIVTDHLPDELIYIDLPAVLVLDGGTQYIEPPKVKAFIDTSIYPEPKEEAVLEAVMSLDSVISVNVINPGLGYAVLPEIRIDPALVVNFTNVDVNDALHTISIYAPTISTGSLIKFTVDSGVTINGLTDNQWYYVNLLEATPSAVIGLYSNYSDAINDHDRLQINSQGTGTYSLSLGAKASAISTSYPIRENNITLRFDRTTYNSRVIDWEAGRFYGAFFAGDYTNSEDVASSSISLESTQPPINTIFASAQGFVLEVQDVNNRVETVWSSFIRRASETVEANDVIRLTYDSLETNASGSTIGFAAGMPIKFTGDVGPILNDSTTYYVAEVVNDSDFKVSLSVGGPVLALTDYTVGAAGMSVYTAKVTDTTILTVNYPGIRTLTATEETTNYLTVPLTDIGTGGTQGFYINMPLFFTGETFGRIRENQTYYVTTIVDNQTFTMSETEITDTTTVYATYSAFTIQNPYAVEVDTTVGLAVSEPIIFNNMTIAGSAVDNFGGLVSGQLYYILEIVDLTHITVSETINGLPLVLTDVSSASNTEALLTSQVNVFPLTSATGNLTLNVSLPVSPGQINGQRFGLYNTSVQYTDLTAAENNLIEVEIAATIGNSLNLVAISESNGSTTNMYVNMPIEVETNIGGLTVGTTYYITDIGVITVDVTGTLAGSDEVVCDDTSALYVGMPIIFAGVGLGGIVIGDQYFVKTINSSTHFTISVTVGGATFDLTTNNGSMTGTGDPYIQVSTTLGGSLVTLSNALGPVTLIQTPTAAPLFDVSYILGGYRVIIDPSNQGLGYAVDNTFIITGNNMDGSSPANDLTLTVIEVGSDGEVLDVICSGNVPQTVSNYYLKVISPTEVEVYSNPLLTQPVALSDFPYSGFTISTATEVASTGTIISDPVVIVDDASIFEVNQNVIFTGEVFGNIVLGQTYYILEIDAVNNEISISEAPNGSAFNVGSDTGSMTVTALGSFAFLPEPFYFNQSIVKYNNQVYQCIISNNDDEFILGKWLLLDSGDRRLNALDRAVGYYQPTVNMPGLDLPQLFTGLEYPNATYLGNPFEPNKQYAIDTILQDQPFYPTEVDSVSVLFNGTDYIVPANLPEYSALLIDAEASSWDLAKLANKPLGLTDIIYADGVYVMTSTNSATPIFRSTNGTVWTTNGYYTPYDSDPYSTTNYDLTSISVASLALHSVAYGNGLYVAVGRNITVSEDTYLWTETYRPEAVFDVTLYGVAYVSVPGFTGFVAVGKGLRYDYSSGFTNLVPTNIILTSTNGITWINTPSITNKGLYGVSTDGTQIVAVGENGVVYQSYNGSVWFGVNELLVGSWNSVNNTISLSNTLGLNVNDPVRFTVDFDVIDTTTTYYVESILSDSLITLKDSPSGTTIILTTTEAPVEQTLMYKYPYSSSFNDILYANSIFMAVGDNGLIATSADALTWNVKTTGTLENLNGLTYVSTTGIWTVVGDNNVIIQSDDNGDSWNATNVLTVIPAIYTVQGDPFLSGYGPEELVPGVVSDGLQMIVNTRPGTNWAATEYAHVGYNVVSTIFNPMSAGELTFSFKEIVVTPAQIALFQIDKTTGLSTSLYVGIDYTVNWVNQTVTLTGTNPLNFITTQNTDTLRIDVYEVGNGDQLVKANTETDPIRLNTLTEFHEIYLNCNYSDSIFAGGGVIRPGTEPTELRAIETVGLTNSIVFDENVSAFTVNQEIKFSGAVFGNIQEDTPYYVKSISLITNSITVSTTLVSGIAGPTLELIDYTGSDVMLAIIQYGTGQVWTDPIVLHNGNRLTLGLTSSVVRTKSAGNKITCNTTSSMDVDDPIVFSATIFGGIQGGILSVNEIVEGQTYRIDTLGDTDFTAIGAANNTAGLYFEASYLELGLDGYIDSVLSTEDGRDITLEGVQGFDLGTGTITAVYYVDSIIDINEFTIRRTLLPQNAESFIVGRTYKITSLGDTDWNSIGFVGTPAVGDTFVTTGLASGTGEAVEIVALTNATGEAIFITRDYAIGVAPNGISAKVMFPVPYYKNQDYLVYSFFNETAPEQYGYTLPETQLFEGDGIETEFLITNFTGGDNPESAIVEVNGLRQIEGVGNDYTIDSVTDMLEFVSAPTGTISVTTYNDTQRQYLITSYDGNTSATVTTISNINNTISPYIAITNVTNTTNGTTNQITCASTNNFIVGQTIQFKGVAFGDIETDGTVYFIRSIDSITSFTIEDEDGNIIPLSTASGLMVAYVGGQEAVRVTTAQSHGLSTNDIVLIDGVLGSTQLNNNTYYIHVIDSTQFDLFGSPYDPAFSAPNQDPIISVSTYISGGYVWENQQFILQTTTASAVSSSNNYITVLDTTKLIVDTPVLFMKQGTNIGSAVIGNIIAGTTYYVREIKSSTEFTISDSYQGDEFDPGTASLVNVIVTQWEQTNVDRLWVTVNGYRVPSDKLKLNPANQLSILTEIQAGDDIIITSMMPSATPNELVYINLVNQTGEGRVYRANTETRTWLTRQLTDLDTTIYLDDINRVVNLVEQTNITPAPIDNVVSIGLISNRINLLNVTVYNNNPARQGFISPTYYAIELENLAPILKITFNTNYIETGDELTITSVEGDYIIINGEQIRFQEVDIVNNTLTQLIRGANGTGVNAINPKYTEVYGILESNRMTQVNYDRTWNSDNYNTIEGDPLQISNTQAADFLRVDIT
jgi:hypothetical protein